MGIIVTCAICLMVFHRKYLASYDIEFFTFTGGRACGLHLDKDENTQEPIANQELAGTDWQCLHFIISTTCRCLILGYIRAKESTALDRLRLK